jgi:hypothetical protein
MHAWHVNYDAMQLILIKRNRNSDTHTYMIQVVLLLVKFKCLLAWQNKTSVNYTKLNEVGKPYLVIPNYSTYYLLGVCKLPRDNMMRDENKLIDDIVILYTFF